MQEKEGGSWSRWEQLSHCLPEPTRICSGQATKLCGLGHDATVEKLRFSVLQVLRTSHLLLPRAEIGCKNYLKTKPLSPQILISCCPKQKATFNPQLVSGHFLQRAEFNGARCTRQDFTVNFQQRHEVWALARAVNLPFVFWKTRPAGGYLIARVTPAKAHAFVLPFWLSRSSKPAAGQQLPGSWR